MRLLNTIDKNEDIRNFIKFYKDNKFTVDAKGYESGMEFNFLLDSELKVNRIIIKLWAYNTTCSVI